MNNLVLLVLICSFSFLSCPAQASDADENDDEPNPTKFINGQPVIFLDEDTQAVSGLKTEQLKSIAYQPEYIAFGETVDLTELQAIHYQFFATNLQKTASMSRMNRTSKNISRLQMLHKNEAISSQKLYTQQLQSLSDKANFAAINYQTQSIINQSKLKWGKTLTDWATTNNSTEYNQLMEGLQTLLQVTLPAGKTLPPDINNIYISASGERHDAVQARLISPSAISQKHTQGLQYFFVSDNKALKPGMRFTAWIAEQTKQQMGLIIPESAIVRHLSQSIIFLKIDEQQFLHHNINKLFKVAQGYFIAEPDIQNNEVVIEGAQMLLSHEFRSQIPDEDDDD